MMDTTETEAVVSDDSMEMEIDETVPNTTIIENKTISETLSNVQSPKDPLTASQSEISDDDDFVLLDTSNKIKAVNIVEPVVSSTVAVSNDDEIVILDDDDDEPMNKSPPPLSEVSALLTIDNTDPKDSTNVRSRNNLEIIDLVSKKPGSANSKCINYSCKSGINMLTAPGFCLTFYRVNCNDKKRRKVCEACCEIASLHFFELSQAVKNDKALLDVVSSIRNDLVEIDDSDSDEDEVDEILQYFADDDFKYVEKNIDNFIQQTLVNYNLPKLVHESGDHVLEKGRQIAEEYASIDASIHEIRKMLDKIHHDTYATFKVSYEHLPPVEIYDVNNSHRNGIRIMYPSDSKEARNLRKVKPVSYAEHDDANSKTDGQIVVNNVTKEAVDGTAVPHDLPPVGSIEKPPLKLGDQYYAVRFLTMGSWIKVTLSNFVKPGQLVNGTAATETMYCVSMENKQHSKYPTSRILSGKEIAYAFPGSVQFEVGTRVIAAFKEREGGDVKRRKDAFYPGIVAEPLLASNGFRYLIFFDDGYAQYVTHKMVHLIYEASKNVWEDVHVDSRLFIQKYLETYPERPMVMLRKGQKVRTEHNGKWWTATVLNIDASLAQMHFDVSNRVEWIYRGATRLNPMFKEEQAASQKLSNRSRGTTHKLNDTGPYVQYTRNEQEQPEVRAVARKSTSTTQVAKVGTPLFPRSNERPSGVAPPPPPSKVVYFTPRAQSNTEMLYMPHLCSASCKSFITYDFKKLRGYNPLSKPLLCGWNRVTYKHRGKREINYKSPCGLFIRNMGELHKYLRSTESEMTVDLFDFDFWVHCLAEFVLENTSSTIKKDMSDGLEKVTIPIVNYVDDDPIPFSAYSIKRVPMEGVHLNLDPDFLCGCDCEDDCVDKEKCQCWQLTLTGLPFLGKNASEFVGYSFRRLPEPVITGIYECNSKCKCAKTCLNRVVQNPLQLKLQVFKTHSKGWGIRCLNDIPQGAFICIYAGSMLTEQMANEGGKSYGDEYLAELDYIEVVEKMKEDYEDEPAVSDDEDKESRKSPTESGDEDDSSSDGSRKRKNPLNEDDDFVPYMFLPKGRESDAYKSRLRKRTVDENDKNGTEKDSKSGSENDEKRTTIVDDDETVMISDDEDTVHEPSSFNPKSHSVLDDSRPVMYTSVRELYGKDECVYVMDAKVSGNIGRFLNHSCSPNVFVQNVFVDTHDLRFPWVAFFALTYIRAGTELTWNYNYDVGSVPGKILYCHCSSVDCRGRLL